MKIMGMDEAGRGSIIGPMVICGLTIDKKNIQKLKALGVKDSKILSKKTRETLFEKIKRLAKPEIEIISCEEIDMNSSAGINLNQTEAIHMARIINKERPDMVYIDALNGIKKFVFFMEKFLEHKPKMILEHNADKKYPVVSGASIIAKVIRDRELEKIKQKTGLDLGVGYPHDEKSINGLKANIKNKDFMRYVRKSWSTYSRIKEEIEQKRISDW